MSSHHQTAIALAVDGAMWGRGEGRGRLIGDRQHYSRNRSFNSASPTKPLNQPAS